MSLRGLLALIVLLAAAVGALFWIDHRGKPEDKASVDAPLLKAFTEDALRSVDLLCEGSSVSLRHEPPAGWRIAEPFTAEADPRRVRELIAALQDARVRKVVAEADADRAAFGLEPAACTVRLGFSEGAKEATLRLGRSSPVGTERYAVGDDRRVVFTDGSLHAVLSRGAESLREIRLFPVEAEAITRIDIDRPGGRLVLASAEGNWRLERPMADAASAAACASLARTIATLEVKGAASTKAPSSVRAERRLTISITAAPGATPATAYVAAAGIEGTRLGWREGGPLAGLVPEASASELLRPAEGFRESRITTFSVPDVRRVEFERGGSRLRVSRADEAKPWAGLDGSASIPVDGARLAAFLDRLRGLGSSGFVSGPPATAATGTIVVAGEKGDLARLTYGPLPRAAGSNEEILWVTTPARAGVVFQVPAAYLGPIPGSAGDLAPAAAQAAGGS